MTTDRTDELLDLLYGECTAEEEARLREAIDEDEQLAEQWEKLRVDYDEVQEHVPPPEDVPDDVSQAILEKASSRSDQGRRGDAGLPWLGLATAAVVILAASATYYLVVHLAPTQDSVLDEPVAEQAMEETTAESPPAIGEAEQDRATEVDPPVDEIVEARRRADNEQQEIAQQRLDEEEELEVARLDDSDSDGPERAPQQPAPSPSPSPESEPAPETESAAEDDSQPTDFMALDPGEASRGGGAGPAADDDDADGELEGSAEQADRAASPGAIGGGAVDDDEVRDEDPQSRAEQLWQSAQSARDDGDDDRARDVIESMVDQQLIDDLDEDTQRDILQLRRQLRGDEGDGE